MPDVVAQFREYIRLDRTHGSGGLAPAEFERWTRLKRSLGRRFSPGLGDEQSDRRFDEFYGEILQTAARRSDLRRGAAE